MHQVASPPDNETPLALPASVLLGSGAIFPCVTVSRRGLAAQLQQLPARSNAAGPEVTGRKAGSGLERRRRPTRRTIKAKPMQCIRVLTAGDVEHAAVLSSADQADRQRSLEQRGTEHAGDMRPALTPVQAWTAIVVNVGARLHRFPGAKMLSIMPTRMPSSTGVSGGAIIPH